MVWKQLCDCEMASSDSDEALSITTDIPPLESGKFYHSGYCEGSVYSPLEGNQGCRGGDHWKVKYTILSCPTPALVEEQKKKKKTAYDLLSDWIWEHPW